MKNINIAMITKHNCTRVTKEAAVLNRLGYNVHLLTERLADLDNYKTYHYWDSPESLRELVKVLKNIDIWHVHNQPDWMVSVVREALPKSKIVFDCHDSLYWIKGHKKVEGTGEQIKWYQEEIAVQCSDGFVVPSDPCKEELKTRTKKSIKVLPPACPSWWYINKDWDFRGGAVIEGGLAISNMLQTNYWKDYTYLLNQLKEKCDVYVYSPSLTQELDDPLMKHYWPLVADLKNMNYNDLIQEMGKHSWNIVGNIQKNGIYAGKFSMHNKFFDALAAGIPSVIFGVEEVAKLVKKYNMGLICNNVDDFIKKWDLHIEKRRNVLMRRNELSMEKFIGSLLELYGNVLYGN